MDREDRKRRVQKIFYRTVFRNRTLRKVFMANATLQQKLKDKTARIGVVGLGYVGLPLAIEYAQKGFHTVGIDIDKRKITSLKAGKNYIDDIDGRVVAKLVREKMFVPDATYNT